MQKVVQVVNAAAAAAYLSANAEIDACFYLSPFHATVDGKEHYGWENQGYPPDRVYVHR
jgi:hypothetical protein